MSQKTYKEMDWLSQSKYKVQLLESILISTISDKSSKIPLEERFILSELVNGTLKYIGADAGKIRWTDSWNEYNIFDTNISKYFETEMKEKSGKLNPDVRDALMELCLDHYSSGAHRSRIETYEYFENIRNVGVSLSRTYSPTYENVIRVKNHTLPTFSSSERRDIKGIAKYMRQYMDEDITMVIRK